ncbi:hypothetical protein SRHO_G00218180 [Serrasalmus rhombeus]
MKASSDSCREVLGKVEKKVSTTLQWRRKWNVPHQSLKKGGVVRLKDDQAAQNMWPMAVVESVYPNADGKVHKLELQIVDQVSLKQCLSVFVWRQPAAHCDQGEIT